MRTVLLALALFTCAGHADVNHLETAIDSNHLENFKLEKDESIHYSAGLENDVLNQFYIFNAANRDRHKTNTVWLRIESNTLPESLDSFLEFDSHTTFDILIGHDMFTPDDITEPELIENDRPYAGFLYVEFETIHRVLNELKGERYTVGFIGPSVRGEELQTLVHDQLPESPTPEGWDNQLRDEPIFNYQQTRARSDRITLNEERKIDMELVSYLKGLVGNMEVSAENGYYLRIGHNIPDDMILGFRDVSPDDSKFAIYLVFHGSAKVVAHDIFLRGNTFKNSHSVEMEPIRFNISSSLIARSGNWEVGFTQERETEEFTVQDEDNSRGIFYIRYIRPW